MRTRVFKKKILQKKNFLLEHRIILAREHGMINRLFFRGIYKSWLNSETFFEL